MKKELKRNIAIVLITIFVIILAVFLIAFAISYSIVLNSDNKACTEEAKICPDGSAVGRNNSNNCEFDECPDLNNLINSCISLGCAEDSSIYAGSKNSDKYYYCYCGYAKTILKENLVCFANEQEAEADERTKVEC